VRRCAIRPKMTNSVSPVSSPATMHNLYLWAKAGSISKNFSTYGTSHPLTSHRQR
jgi:hypothetical protein